ncbi:hypothetical protein [Lentzea flaviverrucosa]|uniref:YGGT family protein n=1 Tax=Lentzea flaviverrucosa TaxID=200379 RepID=A0A1H9X0W3_9PSEU|nr:hypothetical protein [Lentzea flaviverrucosa]RDI20991.1 hypothetical protein DFR72_114212 [Lentzea flaviverrucosa]SES39770.1 hypothetical protein SAMN05216195_11376 [Lentzea flaviverrucosa]
MRTRVVGIAAGVVSWVGLALAVVLVVHVVLTVGGANPDNTITSTVKFLAEPVALAFKDLFAPADAKLRVIVNFGLAALFWLGVRAIVLKLVRRLN